MKSVDWLSASVTDITFEKREGFGWIRNYECTIPKDGFFELAAKRNWQLQVNDNVILYEKRHPNGGHALVYYNSGYPAPVGEQQPSVHSAGLKLQQFVFRRWSAVNFSRSL